MTTPPTRSPEDVITRLRELSDDIRLTIAGHTAGDIAVNVKKLAWWHDVILSTLSGQHTEATEQPHPLDRLLLNAYGRKCYDAGYAAASPLSGAEGRQEVVKAHVSEIRAGEENDGALESVDLYLRARGISLLVNADLDGDVTYSLSVDGKPMQSGYVLRRTQLAKTPPPDATGPAEE